MAAFVEADRREPVGHPGVGVEIEGAGVERFVSAFVWEDEALATFALLELWLRSSRRRAAVIENRAIECALDFTLNSPLNHAIPGNRRPAGMHRVSL